jgi:hypothetical protein
MILYAKKQIRANVIEMMFSNVGISWNCTNLNTLNTMYDEVKRRITFNVLIAHVTPRSFS